MDALIVALLLARCGTSVLKVLEASRRHAQVVAGDNSRVDVHRVALMRLDAGGGGFHLRVAAEIIRRGVGSDDGHAPPVD